MGGILAADSIYAFIDSRPDVKAPLWPDVIACLAFDTPVCVPPLWCPTYLTMRM